MALFSFYSHKLSCPWDRRPCPPDSNDVATSRLENQTFLSGDPGGSSKLFSSLPNNKTLWWRQAPHKVPQHNSLGTETRTGRSLPSCLQLSAPHRCAAQTGQRPGPCLLGGFSPLFFYFRLRSAGSWLPFCHKRPSRLPSCSRPVSRKPLNYENIN